MAAPSPRESMQRPIGTTSANTPSAPLGAPIYALWFGVTADGTSNDAAALQAAIDSMAGGGGTLILPKGTIYIGTTTIKVNGVMSMVGQGTSDSADVAGTRIKYVGAGTAIQVESENTGTSHGIVLRDFTVDGNNVGAKGMTIGRRTPDTTISVKGIFSNLCLRGFTTCGLEVLAAEGCLFEFVKAAFNRGDGCVMGTSSAASSLNTLNTFLRCEFFTNGNASNPSRGLVVYDGRSQVFQNCNFESNYGDGVRIISNAAGMVTRFVLNDCWWEGNNLGQSTGTFAQLYVTNSGGSDISEIELNQPNFSTTRASGGGSTYYDAFLQYTKAVIRWPTLSDNAADLVRVAQGTTSTFVTVISPNAPYSREPSSWNPVSGDGGGGAVKVQWSLEASSGVIFEYFKLACPSQTSNLTEQRSAFYYGRNGSIYRAQFNYSNNLTLANGVAKTVGSVTGITGAGNDGKMAGGTIRYTVTCKDGTDRQTRSGMVKWGAVNKAGTLTTAVTDDSANQAAALSAGTLAVSWAWSSGNLQVTATSSLTPTEMIIRFEVINDTDDGMSVAAP